MAKSTFFRKLKSLTGLTYVSFIRNIRMKAACRIMEEKKNIRISELAYAVGYNDPRYFSNSFKKEFGMQPSEYMERFTSNGTVEDDVPEPSCLLYCKNNFRKMECCSCSLIVLLTHLFVLYISFKTLSHLKTYVE